MIWLLWWCSHYCILCFFCCVTLVFWWDIGHMCLQQTLVTSAKEVMFLPVFVCLFVCLSVSPRDNSKSYGRIFLKFWGYVGHGISYHWFNFGRDLAGIMDSGSLWNFCYHWGISELLAKWRWWRHLANSFALAEVPALSKCFLWLINGFQMATRKLSIIYLCICRLVKKNLHVLS